MFAYIDEAGHTGSNLFDSVQPIFYYGLLSCKVDFDFVYGDRMRRLAASLGSTSLHGNELGADKVETILPEIQKILRVSDGRFDLSKVNKIDLAVTKLFDTVFDPGENVAVPWQAYNMVAFRNVLLLKLARVLDEALLKTFWGSLLDRKETRSRASLVATLEEIKNRLSAIPDARSREILSGGLSWAIDNPEVLEYHSSSPAYLKWHMPNAVSFPDMLRAIHTKSKQWRRPVRLIKVDQQSQFNATQRALHEIHRNAAPGKGAFPIGIDPVELRLVPESRLVTCASKDSPGIQLVDLLLWIVRQIDKGQPPGPESIELFRKIGHRTKVFDLSLLHISQWTEAAWKKINSADMSDEQLKKGSELLALSEQRRRAAMSAYIAAKSATAPAADQGGA